APDVVVGNPPYVRSERVAPQLKESVRRRLGRDWPTLEQRDIRRIAGRGDLSVACVARSLRPLGDGGRAAFILSTALLDAEYARPLWALARAIGRVAMIVEAPDERWFPDAAVNTCIVVFEKGSQSDVVPLARLRT